MSNTIDNRVVKMEFNNSQFEQNVAESLKTIDKLNQKLEFNEAPDGFANITKAASRVDFSGITDAVETIADRFSTLGIIGVQALQTITDKAVEAGLQLTKSLTIDQFKEGVSKYEQLIAAEQTMAASISAQDVLGAGYAWEDKMQYISDQMQQLMWYSDETSYDFADMANNIAKFTAQNVGLETSVRAMEGIASWAAYSGQNAQAASRAMYNLSQALGMGYVGVADWRSIELANMATSQFKDMVIETAAETGNLIKYQGDYYSLTADDFDTLIEKMNSGKITEKEFDEQLSNSIVTAETFRNTLKDKWFDSNVLVEVLNEYGKFATDLSTILNDLGDGVETAKLVGIINEIVDPISQASKEAKALGKEFDWDTAFNGAMKAAEETGYFNEKATELDVTVEDLIEAVKTLGAEEYNMSREAWNAANESKTFSDAVNYTKDAISSAIAKIGVSLFGEYEEARKVWTDFADVLYDVLVEPFDKLAGLFQELRENGGIDSFFESLSKNWDTVKTIFEIIPNAFKAVFDINDEGKLAGNIANLLEKFNNLSGSLNNFVKNIAPRVQKVFEVIFTVIKGGIDAIKSVLDYFDRLITRLKNAKSDLSGTETIFDKLFGHFKKSKEDISDVTESLDKVDDALEEISKNDSVEKIFIPFSNVKTIIEEIGNSIKNVFGEDLSSYPLIKEIPGTLESIKKYLDSFEGMNFLDRLLKGLDDLGTKLEDIATTLASWAAGHIDTFFEDISTFDWAGKFSKLSEWLNEGTIALKEFLKGSGDVLTTASLNVQDLITSLVELTKVIVSDVLAPVFSTLLHELLSNLPGLVSGLIEGLKGIGSEIAAAGPEILSAIEKSLGLDDASWYQKGKQAIVDFVKGITDGIKGNSKSETKSAEEFIDDVAGALENVSDNPEIAEAGNTLKDAFGNFKTAITSIDKGDIATGLAYFIVVIDTLKSLFAGINIGLLAGNLNGVVSAVKGFVDKLGDAFEGFSKYAIDTDAIKTLGLVAVELTASILVLSLLDETKVEQARKAMVAVVLSLIGIFAAVMLAQFFLSSVLTNTRIIEGSLKELIKGGMKIKTSTNTAGTLLLKIGAAVLLMAIALKVITDAADSENFGKALGAMAGIAAFLILFVVVIGLVADNLTETSKASKRVKVNQISMIMDTVGKAMMKLAIATAILAIVALKIAESEADIWDGVGPVLAIMLAISLLAAGLSWAEKEIGGKLNGLTKVAGSMMALAIGLTALIVPIALYAAIPWSALVKGAVVIGGLILVIGGLALLGAKFKKEIGPGAKALLEIAGVMVVLAIALTAMLVPIAALSILFTALNDGVIWEAIVALAGLIAALVLLDEYLGNPKVAARISLGVVSLLEIAGGLLVFALSVTLSTGILAIAVLILVGLMTTLGTVFAKDSTEMEALKHGAGILLLFVAALAVLAVAVSMAGTPLLIGGAALIVFSLGIITLTAAITSILVPLAIFSAYGETLKTGLENMMPLIWKFLGIGAAFGALSWLILPGAIALAALSAAILVLSAAIRSLAEAVLLVQGYKSLGQELVSTTEETATAIETTVTDTKENVENAVKDGGNAAKDAMSDSCENIVKEVSNTTDKIASEGEEASTRYAAGIGSAGLKSSPQINMAMEKIRGDFSSYSMDSSIFGEDYMNNYLNGMSLGVEGTPDVTSYLNSMLGDEFASYLPTAEAAGSNEMLSYFTGMLGQEGNLGSASDYLASMFPEAAGSSDMLRLANGEGSDIVKQYMAGIGVEEMPLFFASKDLAGVVPEAMGSVDMYNSNFNAGSFVMMGFWQGIKANFEANHPGLTRYLNRVKQTFNECYQIASPSKWARTRGEFLMEGFALGIKDSTVDAERAVEKAADNTKTAFEETIGRISAAIDGDYQPTITPVLDLSNVDKGLANLNSSIGKTNTTIGLAGSITSLKNSQNGGALETSNADLLSAIDRLSEVVSGYMDREDGGHEFKFYLDGRELTSRVTQLQKRAARANGG